LASQPSGFGSCLVLARRWAWEGVAVFDSLSKQVHPLEPPLLINLTARITQVSHVLS
jgi:hypothetical protein